METIERLEMLDRLHGHPFEMNKRKKKEYRSRISPLMKYDDDEFRMRFRFSKNGFRYILNRVFPDVHHTDRRGQPLTPEQKLGLALRYFATGSFQRAVGDLTGVHVSTASRCIHEVASSIAKVKNFEIKLPSQSELPRIKQKFSELSKNNFPGIIGAIDCTHIPIQCPDVNEGKTFMNRKGFYSINCQVICDSNMLIRNIVARWPGSTHDSRIFENCSAKEVLQQGHLRGYLLGDSGYPCRPYLLTPFLKPRNAGEIAYNKAHCRARNVIERLFGVWKRRFPCLRSCLKTKLQTSLTIIVAAAVLHNWAIELQEEDFDSNDDDNDDDDDIVNGEVNENISSNGSGFAVRAAIVRNHFNR